MNLYFTINNNHTSQVQAGGQLSGSLHIQVTKPVRATHINLYFRGKEYTRVEHTETTTHHSHHGGSMNSSDRLETHTVVDHGKHQIMRIDMPVPNQGNMIRGGRMIPGHHQVPFSITLPAHIPSSMTFHSRGGGDSAEIAYCLRAVVKGSGILEDYQARQEVQVMAAAAVHGQRLPYVVPTTTKKITQYWLAKKGEITYGAKCDNTRVAPGEALKLQLALVNNSRVGVDYVKTELEQVVRFSARGHYETIRYDLGKQRFPGHMFATTTVTKGRQDTYEQIQQSINGRGSTTKTSCTLPPVPHDATESYQGMSIQVSHVLQVKIKTNKKGCTNPEFEIPIEIVGSTMTSPPPMIQQQEFQQQQQQQVHVMEQQQPSVVVPMATAIPIYNNNESDGGAYYNQNSKLPPSLNPDYHYSIKA